MVITTILVRKRRHRLRYCGGGALLYTSVGALFTSLNGSGFVPFSGTGVEPCPFVGQADTKIVPLIGVIFSAYTVGRTHDMKTRFDARIY